MKVRCNPNQIYFFIAMIKIASHAEIRQLTANDNPDAVWAKAIDIVRQINPDYDSTLAHLVFSDVLRLFRGEFPGYCAIRTPYHDLHHTLDVFLCALRLAHGVHISGTVLADSEITCIMLSTLFHDIGYAQCLDEDSGTGAQFTLTHVGRGIEFMHRYLLERDFPSGWAIPIACLMNSTNPGIAFEAIEFPDERTRLLGQIVGSADIVGQMADRTYLEKLLFLYQEFNEAKFGNYANLHDLLRQTKSFYETALEKKLNGSFEGVYKKFTFHFSEFTGIENNYYLESIEKNIAYLSKVIALDETEYLSMLKRGGIVDLSPTLVQAAEAA